MREFFVSMASGRRTALLAGPFSSPGEALAMVEPARREMVRINEWAWFCAFGTLSMEPSGRHGMLNRFLGLD